MCATELKGDGKGAEDAGEDVMDPIYLVCTADRWPTPQLTGGLIRSCRRDKELHNVTEG